jgi:hypothetical protein
MEILLRSISLRIVFRSCLPLLEYDAGFGAEMFRCVIYFACCRDRLPMYQRLTYSAFSPTQLSDLLSFLTYSALLPNHHIKFDW